MRRRQGAKLGLFAKNRIQRERGNQCESVKPRLIQIKAGARGLEYLSCRETFGWESGDAYIRQ